MKKNKNIAIFCDGSTHINFENIVNASNLKMYENNCTKTIKKLKQNKLPILNIQKP